MMEQELVALFWGKAGREQEGPDSLHPALFHMLDVGMSARALVERNPATALRDLWPDVPDLARRIGFIIALHDLGKISPGFQRLREDLIAGSRAAGFCFPEVAERDHSRTTWLHLKAAPNSHRAHLALALGAHHGTFPCDKTDGDDGAMWREAREGAISACARAFGVDAAECLDGAPLTTAQVMVLAGLTAVADWLGSDRNRFPREGALPRPLPVYAKVAYQRATDAISEIGWDGWTPKGKAWTFEQLFHFPPNPLQQATITLAKELRGPACVVIEAPMGMGKTEAALFLAEVLLHRAGHAGLYFALPTQATSNPMFKRVRDDYLKPRIDGETVNLHLLHGLAGFDEAYAELLKAGWKMPDPDDLYDGESRASGVVAAGWFRGAKLGLLSPFAVGTVDQALMGVLQTRHPFVRLFGLTNKVVVIDEVHAYDTYTGGVLHRLVQWLAEQRCSVILLSATLPSSRRDELLRAYSGLCAPQQACEYPRVTVVKRLADRDATEKPSLPVSIPVPPLPPATLLRFPEAETSWPDAPAQLLSQELADGGCAVWICNTVDRAQEAYLRLRQDSAFEDAQLLLFHARFPVWQRRKVELAVQTALGKRSERPPKLVLVATQVAEQSLDIDADLMLSDLAPIDLLLQRMGRLHRHRERDADRPAGLRNARCYWIGPLGEANPPSFQEVAGVYERWLVFRTWTLLAEPVIVNEAAQIERLVETVYEGEPTPVPGMEAHAKELRIAFERLSKKHRGWAIQNTLNAPDHEDPFAMNLQLPDPDSQEFRRAVTRLGDPTVTIVCAEATNDANVVRLEDGTMVRLSRKPDADIQSRLVLHSARLSHRGWVEYFGEHEGKVSSWQECPLLSRYRLVRFRNGTFSEGKRVLTLDDELGLITSPHVADAARSSKRQRRFRPEAPHCRG